VDSPHALHSAFRKNLLLMSQNRCCETHSPLQPPVADIKIIHGAGGAGALQAIGQQWCLLLVATMDPRHRDTTPSKPSIVLTPQPGTRIAATKHLIPAASPALH